MAGKRDMFDKLTKTYILQNNRRLRSHIPTTKKMDSQTLRTMLHKERMVYIKPCRGSQGRGVMKVEVERGGGYVYRSGVKRWRFSSFDRMYRAIRKEVGNEPYLVQKGVRLLTYAGKIFDIRVMVQHNPGGKWEVTGLAGRVAHPRKAVTNGSQGGSIYPVETLLKSYLGKHRAHKVMASLKEIGLESVRVLGLAFPHKHEMGVDIALDRHMKPWILEVNWNPDPCPFTKLKDRSALRRILRYAKVYGRTYELNCTKSKQGRDI